MKNRFLVLFSLPMLLTSCGGNKNISSTSNISSVNDESSTQIDESSIEQIGEKLTLKDLSAPLEKFSSNLVLKNSILFSSLLDLNLDFDTTIYKNAELGLNEDEQFVNSIKITDAVIDLGFINLSLIAQNEPFGTFNSSFSSSFNINYPSFNEDGVEIINHKFDKDDASLNIYLDNKYFYFDLSNAIPKVDISYFLDEYVDSLIDDYKKIKYEHNEENIFVAIPYLISSIFERLAIETVDEDNNKFFYDNHLDEIVDIYKLNSLYVVEIKVEDVFTFSTEKININKADIKIEFDEKNTFRYEASFDANFSSLYTFSNGLSTLNEGSVKLSSKGNTLFNNNVKIKTLSSKEKEEYHLLSQEEIEALKEEFSFIFEYLDIFKNLIPNLEIEEIKRK